jgi:hypothetical protein
MPGPALGAAATPGETHGRLSPGALRSLATRPGFTCPLGVDRALARLVVEQPNGHSRHRSHFCGPS